MLDSQVVTAHLAAFGCCAGEAGAQAITERNFGNTEEAECLEAKAAYWMWAASVMERTPTADDDGCCKRKCITDEFALKVIQKASPGCVECGCGNFPPTCDITQDYTVYAAVDAGYQPQAIAGQPYLIVSDLNSWGGTWGTHVGDIVVNTTFTTPAIGKITLDAFANRLWVQTSAGQGWYYPMLSGSLSGSTLTVTSAYPAVDTLLGRDIMVQTSTDAFTDDITTIYLGNENAVEDDYTVDPETLYMRTYFLVEDCQYGPFLSQVSIDANPPLSGRSYRLPVTGDIEYFSDTFTTNPFYEPSFRAACWFKFNQIPGDSDEAVPFGIFQNGATYYYQFSISPAPNEVGRFQFGYQSQDLLSSQPLYQNTFITDAIPGYDMSQWHHLCVVKNSTGAAETNGPADFKFFVDGVEIPIAQLTLLNTVTQDTITSSTVQIIRRYGSGEDMYADEIYLDLLGDSSNIATVIMPNLMDQVYGSGWLYWYRAEVPDDLDASPFSTPNAPDAPYIRNNGGSATISTDVPPLLA